MSPTVASLRKIVGGLGMSVAEFFADEPSPVPNPFQRADELIELGSDGISLRLVGSRSAGRALQLLVEHHPAGSDTGPEMLQHPGDECGVVISGQIEVSVGSWCRTLGPGDGFYFSSGTPHRFRNLGDAPCELVSAATPPTF